MSRRYGEWELLDCDSDPVPASQAEVDEVAKEMGDRSDEASDIRDLLKKLSNLDGWKGKAAEAFADKADDALEDLGKVEDRYREASQALYAWGNRVNDARIATNNALTKAVGADEDMRKYPEGPGVRGLSEMTPEEKADDEKHGAAKDTLSEARNDLRDAMHDLDEAAKDAEEAIGDAADIWDDGWTGNVGGWIRRHAETIDMLCKILQVVAAVLGAIILVLAIVAAAPFALIVLAAAAGVLLVAGQVALVLADTGKADGGDVAWSVLGLAATLFGGKLTASAAKGLVGLVPSMASRIGGLAKNAALARLVGGNNTQFANALRIANPQNNLARWAAGLRGAADGEGQVAAQAVDDLVRVDPSKLKILVTQNRQLARMHTTVDELKKIANVAEQARLDRIGLKVNGAIGANVTGNVARAHDVPEAATNTIELMEETLWSTHPTH